LPLGVDALSGFEFLSDILLNGFALFNFRDKDSSFLTSFFFGKYFEFIFLTII
jgi:hypothetical protein